MIRSIRPGEGTAVSDIAAQSWRTTYSGIYTANYIESWIAEKYNSVSVEREIQKAMTNDRLIFLGFFDDEMKGFIELKVEGRNSELLRLYIKPDSTGKGIGSELLREAECRFGNYEVNECNLYVNRKNMNAIKFYEKNLFLISGVKGDDLNMKKRYD